MEEYGRGNRARSPQGSRHTASVSRPSANGPRQGTRSSTYSTRQNTRPPGASRPAGDRQARARAMARKKRRRRQRRMIIGGFLFLLVLIISGIFYGVSSHKKEKARQELLKEGIASMESENHEAAIGKFQEILDGSKGKPGKFEVEVLTYRGEAEYKQKDYEAAVQTFELLLKEDGEKERYQQMLCFSQMELGNYDEALKYKMADAEIYNRMALRDIGNKEYDAAMENVKKGLAASAADDPARQNLAYSEAVIYEKKGDFAKALKLFETYLKTYGSDEEVEREVAFLKTRQGGTEAGQSQKEAPQSDAEALQPAAEVPQGDDAA